MKIQNITNNIIWNTVGNMFYFACHWLLSVIVARISFSYADIGVLSLAMSVTGIFTILAGFNVRNYQVSDLDNRYTQSDYVIHRFITCILSLLLCFIFVAINEYNLFVALSIIGYMFVKNVEALADVFHGIMQRQWRFDIIGKSCIYRGVVILVAFTVIYRLFGELWIALFGMAIMAIIVFCLYDLRQILQLTTISLKTSKTKLFALTLECLPLLIYILFFNLITPTVRFFIEHYHGEEMLGYYGSVASIALIVQAMVGVIFAPFNGIITDNYTKNNNKAILLLSGKVLLLLVALTTVALTGAWLLGKPVLVIMFGESIVPYVWLLYPTILASCLTSLVWFLGMLLTIMRSMKSLIIGSMVGFMVCLTLSVSIIPQLAYNGANIATITGLAVLAVIYIIEVLKKLIIVR